MKRCIALASVAMGLVLALSSSGCVLVPKKDLDDCQAELQASKEELTELQRGRGELHRLIAGQQKQIQTLMKLGDKRLEKLFHVAKIELGRYTGGLDTDGKEGHDAIKVFLRPLDKSGSVIKAAGRVKIQLYDLAEKPGENLLGEYVWDVDEISGHWSSAAFTYHYSFECPFKSRKPDHEEITVRAEFTDYLTGKTFSAQKVCKIRLSARTGDKKTTTTKPAE